ncbi:hypothetical protein MK805_10160 [Shimazuella sp. AN120528]|uniref:hypothetical protein n=1 Tax=Shimazuella soli TaxID=1892854 RepID=UPI001F0F7B44|nr:hypothetical protein [Shimazuella soli]MCH5585333.1 hypothetical protein [Shimazuella soli]
MTLADMKQIGKELARYLVYCCEQEDYVTRMDHLRLATSRLALIEAIYFLYQDGEPIAVQSTKTIQLTSQQIEELCTFIRTGDIHDVRQLHTSMICDIAAFDLEKIHQIEQYIEQLLADRSEGEINR